jgi:hypothetical protein
LFGPEGVASFGTLKIRGPLKPRECESRANDRDSEAQPTTTTTASATVATASDSVGLVRSVDRELTRQRRDTIVTQVHIERANPRRRIRNNRSESQLRGAPIAGPKRDSGRLTGRLKHVHRDRRGVSAKLKVV